MMSPDGSRTTKTKIIIFFLDRFVVLGIIHAGALVD